MVAVYGAEPRFGKPAAVSSAPRGVEKITGAPCPRQSAITKSAAASRRFVAVSGRASPATRGPRPTSLPALRVDALNEKVVATIDGELRDHQARRGRHSAGQRSDRRRSARHQDAAPFTAADEEVMATFITRLRQSWEEELRQRGQEQCSLACSRQSSGCRQRCMAGHKRPQKLVGWAACPPRIGRSPVPEICQSAFF